MKPISSFRCGAGTTVLLMTAATLLSKLLGMLRSLLLAASFGTGPEASAFSAAIRIPMTLFDLLLSTALTAGMLPILGTLKHKEPEKRDAFLSSFMTLSWSIGGILTLLGIFLAPALIRLTAPGLEGEARETAVTLTRLVFPSLLFCTAAYSLVALLQSLGRFLLPAFVSALSNGTVILYLLFSSPLHAQSRVIGLAVFYTIGWLVQALTLLVPLLKSGLRLKPRIRFSDEGMKRAIRLSLPATLCAWLIPLTTLVCGARASFLHEGGSAIFDYASGLWLLLAGICTHSLTAYLFPRLTAASEREFDRVSQAGLTSILALTLPISSTVMLLSERGVCLLYLRGAFTPDDARLTASLLRLAALSIPAFAWNEWLGRICLASNLLSPPRIAVGFGMVAAVITAPLAPSLPLLGLSLTAGQVVSTVTLLLLLRRRIPSLFDKGFTLSFLKIIACTAASTCICALLTLLPFPSPTEAGMLTNLCAMAASFLPAVGLYLLLCRRLHLNISLS